MCEIILSIEIILTLLAIVFRKELLIYFFKYVNNRMTERGYKITITKLEENE